MERKRYTIRFPTQLARQLEKISLSRGISVNSLVTEKCWEFVEDFKKAQRKISNL